MAKKIKATYHLYSISNLDLEFGKCRTLDGFNVTIPYKESIISYLDQQDSISKAVGAVNCVKREGNTWIGFNTDVYGFYKLIKQHEINLYNSSKVLIIGAGGAAKACYYCLRYYFDFDVFITNRTPQHAKTITNQVIEFNQATKELPAFDIVINATNVGINSSLTPIKLEKINSNAIFIDLNYQNELGFLNKANQLGAKTINGRDMFLHQAALSYQIWLDDEANIEVMNNTLERILLC